MLTLLLLALLGLCCLVHSTEEYFAICTCAKYEEDIGEWLQYHLLMGTAKIYLFDNSGPEYKIIEEAAKPWVEKKRVVYERMSKPEPQRESYEKCHTLHRHKHTFMAFFDVDEYIVLANQTAAIPTVLRDYETFGALALNWVEYGSSGLLARPAGGGVIAHYHKCHPHKHVKLIINTSHFSSGKFLNPHQAKLDEGFFTVNEKYHKVNSHVTKDTHYSKIYLHHYVLKSAEDFARKSNRGSGWRPDRLGKSWTFFRDVDLAAQDECAVLKMPETERKQ